MNDERNKAIQLADRLDTLGLSLILKQTADELRRLHGENEVLRQFLRQIWQGLTDEDIGLVSDEFLEGALWAEAKLKEKNT
jgi:hypothetical protein